MDKNYAENRKKEPAHYTTTSISQQQQQKRNKLPTCTLVSTPATMERCWKENQSKIQQQRKKNLSSENLKFNIFNGNTVLLYV